MDQKTLSSEAIEARRNYKRAWNAKNRERCREYTREYWERKAAQAQAAAQTSTEQNTPGAGSTPGADRAVSNHTGDMDAGHKAQEIL